ncbi:MAG: DUF1906 domain-containing protein [Lactobacillales bacterium]|jgi:peptidoglycan hydrolase-like protein with peptidoglycan-binding domain|nr:DUF1906 domain-containing protein [Lactobacillales bacterium]
MADERVLATQRWLNATYGSVSGFGSVPEDGKTGWLTIYGLIRGLQHEFGIENLVDNFGPTTIRNWDDSIAEWWKNAPARLNGNFVYLIQGAFWCKGIDPGGFNGEYSGRLKDALMELQSDAGFSTPSGTFESMWAKCLFDMSAFVLVQGGDDTIRKIQQWINANFYQYCGVLSADGIYQRDTNSGLIYALQAMEGMSPEESTGTYGNKTTELTPTITASSPENLIKLLQSALYVNGFYKEGGINGKFTEDLSESIYQFRKFMNLTPYNNIADMTVVKGLLSSSGNVNRKTEGVDASTKVLTESVINTLKNNGITHVGRYLTGTVGVPPNDRDKSLSREELQLLFNAGLSVFPIYQDDKAQLSYFSYSQGLNDGTVATAKAKSLGIPTGTVIYFAVDIDVLGDDISGIITPHFKGVIENTAKNGYVVGIYGTRNVCNKVIAAGYAKFAFVSDMSTGFSGNLGFPMPRQWAFDQILEETIGSGDGSIGVDHDAISGRDNGFNSFSAGEDKYEQYIEHNKKMIEQMLKVYQLLETETLDCSINPHLSFYRYKDYNEMAWNVLAAPVSQHDKLIFDDLWDKLNAEETMLKTIFDPYSGKEIDLSHMIVTLQTHLFLSAIIYEGVADFAGWAGDLLTCWGYAKTKTEKKPDELESFLYEYIGSDDSSTFGKEDFYQDIDAYNLAQLVKKDGDEKAITAMIEYYINGGCQNRTALFIRDRFGGSDHIFDETLQLLTSNPTIDILGEGLLLFFITLKVENHTMNDFLGDGKVTATAWANKLNYFFNSGLYEEA